MKLRNRFLLIGFGLLVFAIATPFLILYALGFQYDFSTHHITKTGTLIINTDPAKATVTLNGKIQPSLTPATIRFLIPGDYEITLSKDGYQSWSKRLPVRQQLVTGISQVRDDVFLFLNQAKELSTQTQAYVAPTPTPVAQIVTTLENLNITPPTFTSGQIIQGNNQIYVILDDALYLANGTLQKIYAPVTDATWDSDSRLLLFSNNNEIFTYNPQTQQSELVARTLTPLKNGVLNWTTGYVFFENENEIKAIELDGRDHRNIFSIVATSPNFQAFSLNSDGDTLTVSDTDLQTTYQIR